MSDKEPLAYSTSVPNSRSPRDGSVRIASAIRFGAYAIVFLAGSVLILSGRNSDVGLMGMLIMIVAGIAALVNMLFNLW